MNTLWVLKGHVKLSLREPFKGFMEVTLPHILQSMSQHYPMSCFQKYILVIAEFEIEHKIKYNIHSMEIYI